VEVLSVKAAVAVTWCPDIMGVLLPQGWPFERGEWEKHIGLMGLMAILRV